MGRLKIKVGMCCATCQGYTGAKCVCEDSVHCDEIMSGNDLCGWWDERVTTERKCGNESIQAI